MPEFNLQMWQQAVQSLKELIGPDNYSSWFSPTQLHTLDQDRVILEVPSVLYKQWIGANYLPKLNQLLKQMGFEQLQVDLMVAQESTEELGIEEAEHPTPPSKQQQFLFPETRLNPRYVFETFVVGECNRFAYTVAYKVSEPHLHYYNPVFIYGSTGLGKTHLMQAIGHRYRSQLSQGNVTYVTSEQFVNAFINAIANKSHLEFRNYYRSVDLLLIDDVHFFAGKERTQTEFFHTFNALYDAGKKIVISSDRSPGELPQLEERLRSRFEWGIIVDLQPPDLETRIAILKKKAEAEAVELPDEVALFIAERVNSNIRQLEGALLNLKAFAQMHNKPIEILLAQRLLGEHDSGQKQRHQAITLELIQVVVCEYFDLRLQELISNSRLKKFAYPRHVAQYLSRQLTSLSLPEIGKKFGGRDHSSVLHACRKIEQEVQRNSHLADTLNYLTKLVKERSLYSR